MVTDKDIVNYLKSNNLMYKAYIIDWFIKDLLVKNANATWTWLGGGSFIGYVKNIIFFGEEDTFDASRLDNFINVNYDTAKLAYDKFKAINYVLDRTYKR